MLERASTCLESGGRQLFRSQKPCLRSRRMLHSNFWYHGASDLSLPVWWAPTSIFSPACGDVDDRAANTATSQFTRQNHGELLDFLYPEKTLALLKRLSVLNFDAQEPGRRQLYAKGVRKYSTTRALALDDDTSADAAVEYQAKEEAARLLRGSDAVEELRKALASREIGKQEVAWQLYTAIPEAQFGDLSEMRCDLLEYLTQDGDRVVPGRVLEIFSELDHVVRRTSSYQAAIGAYVALRMVGPAMNLLEELDGSQNIDTLHVGTDVLLRRTVADEQWDLTLRIFKTFLRQTPTIDGNHTYLAISFGNTLPELWQEAAQLPELLEHLQSFLRYVREFSYELRYTPQQENDLSCFIMTFVPHVIDRVIYATKPDELFIWEYFVTLFDGLEALDLPTSACYEYAIKRMLEIPRYQDYTNKPKIWLVLYRRYRQHYVDHPESTFETQPSENLIRNLIFQHVLRGSMRRVPGFLKDLRTFYPDRPLRSPLLKHLIQAYAIWGDAERVQEYVTELQTTYKHELDLKVLSSLPYVYARRADVNGTIAQLRRLHEEFGMAPDAACWNILLFAYIRADDLDGALECFNNLTDYGITPDEKTFGPLIDLCAQRGDIEAFEALFSKAKNMGIRLDADVRARSGYVQASLNAGDVEGAETIAHGMLRSWQAGTLYGRPLTETWNHLIQHHALNGDLAASRRCYQEMVTNNIPLDSWTYGGLMRALVEVKQTNAAYKILRVTMPQNGFQVHALHYAIVMTGFLREKQVEQAVRAYDLMMERKVPHTASSREASIQALGTAELKVLAKRRAKHKNYRLLRVQEALSEMLTASSAHEIAHQQPEHRRLLDVHGYGAVPQAYFGHMISLYSARSAYRICKRLFKKAKEAAPGSDNYGIPLTLITAMMEAHYKAGKHKEVIRCWALARASADRLTKTFYQAGRESPAVPASESPAVPAYESLLDPFVEESFQESRISNNRRQILIKPIRIYVRSLLVHEGDIGLEKAQLTLRDLLTNGFTIDNFTWNELIQHLASLERFMDAFSLCEHFLMPRFPGWRYLMPGYIRNDRPGYQWMELRHYEIKKASVLPRYKTLVLLAKAWGQVRDDERNGIGYDVDAQAWMREILEQSAPMTVRAIETMPRTNDKLQEKYFHSAP